MASVALAGSILFVAFVAQAALVYEGFNYPTGTLTGASGGGEQGFASGSSWEYHWNSDYNVESDSLNCDAFPFIPQGNHVTMPDNTAGTRKRQLDSSATINFDADGEVYYISALMRAPSSGLAEIHISHDESTYFGFGVGDARSGNFELFTRRRSPGEGIDGIWQSGSPAVADTTYFIIAKIETASGNNNDTISLTFLSLAYIQNTEPTIWDIQQNGIIQGNADYLFLYSEDGGQIDEIRMGTTWAEVAVPEPATLTLLLAGSLLTLIRKRK